MKKLWAFYLILLFNCNDDQDCFTVVSKVITNGEYILVGDFDNSNNVNSNNNDDDGPLNGYADVNHPVSQDVYNAYNIGDEYCFE